MTSTSSSQAGAAGSKTQFTQRSAKRSMDDHVHFIGFADDADLPALYSAALITAVPSLYEGFGIPVLESMACGTPVVTSNVSSLPEVAGDAALTVDPTDLDAIVDALAAPDRRRDAARRPDRQRNRPRPQLSPGIARRSSFSKIYAAAALLS